MLLNKKFKKWLKNELYFWLRSKGLNSNSSDKLNYIKSQKNYYKKYK